MGKLKGFIQDWLDEYGYDKGFTWNNIPSLDKLRDIRKSNIDAKEYCKGGK